MLAKCPKVVLITLILAIPGNFIVGSTPKIKNKAHEAYIIQYKDIAVSQMKIYKIPASITLSQGILESGAGMSELSKKSNNHFGIKCNTDWSGRKVIAADDTPTDCFRKYDKVEDSYHDHSKFLAFRPRYSQLFLLDITDYKGWSRGLQTAGYATDKAYANKLIKIIEDNELYLYDRAGAKEKIKREERKILEPSTSPKHVVYKTNGLVYTIAQRDDTFKSIANEFNFKEKDLYKFNEVGKDYPLQDGDIIYFEHKNKKATKQYSQHKIEVGESMYTISQKYGIRVKNLYKLNNINIKEDFVPVEGFVLKLR